MRIVPERTEKHTLNNICRYLLLIIKRFPGADGVASVQQRGVFSLEYRMKGAGTVANARNRAGFKGNDDWEGLERARFNYKAQKTKEEIAAYLEGMGKTLFDSKAQNINRYGLNLCILTQSGLQNMIKISLNDGRAHTEVGLSTTLFTQK
jgi:hypothetical protein